MSRETKEELRRALAAEARLRQRAVDALDEAVADRLGVNRTDLRCLDVLMERESATPGQLATARCRSSTRRASAPFPRAER